MIQSLLGMDVILNSTMTKMLPRPTPRSKKRRIRQKWEKRYPVKWVPDPNYYVIGNGRQIVMHPAKFAELERKLKAVPT